MKGVNTRDPDPVQSALMALLAMDREGLVERWAAVFGCPAPRHSRVGFLRSALAWQVQMECLKRGRMEGTAMSGRISRVARALKQAHAGSAPSAIAPGTRLLREWQGATHHVTVLADGFEYAGQPYRSLTAIAREITGMAWSGPLFFGLRK